MARPKKIPGQPETPERLVAAARKLFAEKGYRGTSLEDIAAAVEIKAPAILYYFESKQALFEEVVRRLYEEVEAIVDASIASAPTATELFSGNPMQPYLPFLRENRQLFSVALAEMLGSERIASEAAMEIYVRTIDKIEKYLRSLVSPPPPKSAPVRAAIMQLTTAWGARIAMNDDKDARRLWGPDAQMLAMTVQVLRAALKSD